MSKVKRSIGIGVNAWVWTSPFDDSAIPLIQKAVDMGFDAFTVPVEAPELINVSSIRSALQDSPVRLHVSGAYGPDRDLTHDDPAVRKNSLNYIRDTLRLCEQLGVKILAGPAYSAVGKRRQISAEQKKVEWERAVEGLTQAGKMAADHGVTMAIEPLNRFETDLINTAAQVKQLIRDIDLPSVKIHLDTFHMNIEEKSVLDAVRIAGDDLVYVDASESDRGAPGSGQVHWQELAQGLAEIGYRGDCIIESFTPDCKTIADAAAIWRPLAASQDDLAKDGRKFLVQLLQ
ncbi:D-psicose/D-tagatose/L-ribulose 3-epimerase [Litorivivens lipolytica]|uniref:D-psicose/D-tagatose/L-ribulose 3-epimerase n=1 Tax=Litorivivens lipolytica TaxID=1524264 RepID=A0A7W4Z678_9GAMM|nr:sugar phosphate isomerase/epimerase family protein [Litorivivens lipolytica]MBB3047912.1 D-psicose/D-tagatose/L-ribulose 3-epimerase [Litorivivens lipolytica]